MDFEPLKESIYQSLPDLLFQLTEPFEGREKDIVLLSTLGVLSNSLPNLHGKYAGVEVSANLYLMILAPPASGKGVMNYARKLIEKIDDEIITKSKKAQKEWKKKKSSDEEKDLGPFPPLELKIIPGNISSSDLYEKIKNAHHGGIIIESETDTLNAIMKLDFGDFSDVLRKAFHHEPLSISRKTEKQFDKIARPKLSLLLSGTPDQLEPFIKSTKNGLFSRIIYYYFNEIDEWKEVFSERGENPDSVFEEVSEEIFALYFQLSQKDSSVEFRFTEEQIKRFRSAMSESFEEVCKTGDLDFVATVKRHGLMMFRIAMILTAIRKRDDVTVVDQIYCDDKDFDIALELIVDLLQHAEAVFTLKNKVTLDHLENIVFQSLDKVFDTSTALEVGVLNGIPPRTMAAKLNKWKKLKVIVKMYHGRYRKA